MKKKIKEELRSKTVSELEAEVLKKQFELNEKRMNLKAGKVSGGNIKNLSDILAVVKTILNEKRLDPNLIKKGLSDKKEKQK